MTADRENMRLTPEEEKFVKQLAVQYAPAPLTPEQRAAFDRALGERLACRVRAPFRRSVAIVAAACAALLLWIAVRDHGPSAPAGKEGPGTVVAGKGEGPPSAGEATLLTYAYDSADFYGDDGEGDEENFLPDEYEALAAAFDLPGA